MRRLRLLCKKLHRHCDGYYCVTKADCLGWSGRHAYTVWRSDNADFCNAQRLGEFRTTCDVERFLLTLFVC